MAGFHDVTVSSREPALVGRLAERERGRRAIARAATGAGQALLLTGEPGVGKSALLAQVRADAAAAGFLVLAGQAHDAERGLDYAPVIDAFGPDLGRLGPRRASALMQGLPQLGRLFSGVPGRTEVLGEPGMERLRLVDALARLCERVAATVPFLIALDDLHWADGATLQLVHHLLRRLQGDRFLLVASARIGALDLPGDYPTFLASARRLQLLDEVTLDPFGPAEVAALLGALLPGATPGAELVTEVHRRSGGIALFVTALARSMRDADALVVLDGEWTPAAPGAAPPLPPELHAVLAERLSRLDRDDRDVLDLLAVHAAPLPYPVLLGASGRADADLLDALGRLTAAGVVAEADLAGTAAFAVSHALLGEAATAGLLKVPRQRLHLALAGALEDAREDGTTPAVDALARHLRGAGALATAGRVVPALLAAADAATRRGDHARAAEAMGDAVTLLRREEITALRPALEQWAEALYRAGRVAEAIPPWQECLADPAMDDPAADPYRRARVLRNLAAAELDQGRLAAAAAHLDAAATATRNLDDDGAALRAGVLSDRFALAERREDLGTAQAAAADLAELAARTGIGAVLVEAGLARAGLERARGDVEAARRAAADAVVAAGRAGSPALQLRALGTALEVAIEAGDPVAIRAHADHALALARRLGSPVFELRAVGCRAAAGLQDGDWRGADRDLALALALSRRFEVPRSLATVLCMRGLLQLFRGDLAAAETTVGEAQRHAAAVTGDRHVAGDVALASSQLALARGDGPKVAELLPGLLLRSGRNVAWRLLTAAQALAFLGRFTEIPEVTARLRSGSPGPYRQGLADWTAGLQLRGAGDPAAAPLLAAAAERIAGCHLPYWAALARLDLAECREGAEAREPAEVALDALERLGARRDADRARRRLRGLGARPRPARRPGVAGGPLSARELEVSRLFAEGMTTAEVAGRLVLSPHTVTAHLRRIYERLGVHSRAALTRVLAEQDLLGTYRD